MGYCEACFEKQLRIDRLEEENKSLKAKLQYRTDKDLQPFFGSSTPSSKIPVKQNTIAQNRAKKGGARPGHPGMGRQAIAPEQADEVIELTVAEECCPDCGGQLEHKGTAWRSIVDSVLNKAKNLLYQCEIKRCVKCKRTVRSKPVVLPKNKYGNNLVSTSAIMHYLHGIPLKRIEEIWGTNVIAGNLIKIFHRLAAYWKPALEQLKDGYRQHPVKHADETSWRTDGQSGYSWLFCTDNISIFAFRETRSAAVPREMLGTKRIPGVLVVDRYGGYNKSPCAIQYCYAHLLRTLDDMGKDFPENKEIQTFVSCVAPLLAQVMHLQAKPIANRSYYQQARTLQKKIRTCIRSPAEHPAIQTYQDIFRLNNKRLYHWVTDRRVPAHNNRAERELRPIVIARKVSFGSQSVEGAHTRSVLMSIIHTAAKRLNNDTESIEEWFAETIKAFVANPSVDPYSLLPKLGCPTI